MDTAALSAPSARDVPPISPKLRIRDRVTLHSDRVRDRDEERSERREPLPSGPSQIGAPEKELFESVLRGGDGVKDWLAKYW